MVDACAQLCLCGGRDGDDAGVKEPVSVEAGPKELITSHHHQPSPPPQQVVLPPRNGEYLIAD